MVSKKTAEDIVNALVAAIGWDKALNVAERLLQVQGNKSFTDTIKEVRRIIKREHA